MGNIVPDLIIWYVKFDSMSISKILKHHYYCLMSVASTYSGHDFAIVIKFINILYFFSFYYFLLYIFSFIIFATLGTYHILTNILRLTLGSENNNDVTLTQLVNQYTKEYGWLLRLFLNCFGYSCIFIPGFIIHKYTKAVKYFERSDINSFIPATVKYCLLGGSDVPDYGYYLQYIECLNTC